MSDSHTILLKKIEQVQTSRSETCSSNTPYLHFWDSFQPKGKDLDLTFKAELSRTGIYEELQGVASGPHRFKQWLPSKVRLSFLSSFERDTRLCYRRRIQAFTQAAKGHKLRAKAATDTIDKIKAVEDGSGEGGGE